MNHGQCIHFTGLMQDRCAAGVCYREAFGGSDGIFLRMPCIQFREVPKNRPGTLVRFGEETVRKEMDRRGEAMVPCALFQAPTDQQVQESREASDKATRGVVLALQVASEWAVKPKPPLDRHDVVECPSCGGKLHLHQSSYNGHVHGRCETPLCLHWIT